MHRGEEKGEPLHTGATKETGARSPEELPESAGHPDPAPNQGSAPAFEGRNPPPGWRPKLVALDVDGTIVNRNGVLPDFMKAAVERVKAAGVPVVIATGRGWQATKPIVKELELPRGPHVLANGAMWVLYPPLTFQRVTTFDPADVIRQVSRLAPGALIAVEDAAIGFRASAEFPPEDLPGEVPIQSLEELAARRVIRVIVRDPTASDRDFIALASRLGLHGVSYAIGWSAWLDIAPEGVTKATALAELTGTLGIDQADVLAIGDGRNDVEMLRWAGRGVAVGDGPPEVHAAADFSTGLFADGGTADELDRWFG